MISSASVIQEGISDRLILQDGGQVSREQWGADVVTARWRCKTRLIEQLLPREGDRHPVWRSLEKVSHRFTDTKGGMTDLECTYRGFVDGRIPLPKITPSQSIGNAQLTRLGFEGDLSAAPTVEIEFYSPGTTFEYWSFEEIKSPIYKGQIRLKASSFEVKSRRGAQGKIGIQPGSSLRTALSTAGFQEQAGIGAQGIVGTVGDFNGVAEVLTSDLRSEPMAPNLYKNTETNNIQILPLGYSYLYDLSINESS